jgi:hypothetical protein
VLRTSYACEFRARERCIFVHVGVTADNHCKPCEWMKQCANVAAKSSDETNTCDARQTLGQVLLSAACLDGRAAELLEGDSTFFQLW